MQVARWPRVSGARLKTEITCQRRKSLCMSLRKVAAGVLFCLLNEGLSLCPQLGSHHSLDWPQPMRVSWKQRPLERGPQLVSFSPEIQRGFSAGVASLSCTLGDLSSFREDKDLVEPCIRGGDQGSSTLSSP